MRWPKIIMINSTDAANLLKKFVGRLRIRKRDTLDAKGTTLEAENVSESEFAEQFKVAEEVMHEWRDVLRKLAE